MKPREKETKPARGTPATGKKVEGLSDEEKAAMRETIQERRAGEANDESAVLAKIAEMKGSDRAMAERLHAMIRAVAPALSPKTWYGMPAYANKDGKVVCFFQPAQKFKARYATFGFNQEANLDEGSMWPVAYALKGLTAAEEARIRTLVKRAVSGS